MKDLVFSFIENTIKEKFNFNGSISLESNIQDEIDLDSIDYMELINELEEKFGIAISNEDLENPPKTISDLVKLVTDKKK